MRTLKFALLGLALSPLAHASELDLSLSDETFSARYSSSTMARGAGLDAGWLHHVDNGDVFNVGLVVEQSAGNNDSYALGGQLVAITNDVDDAYAVALGGRFNVGLPMEPKIRVGGHAWLAPKVTTFSNANNFQDMSLRIGYQALERGELYVGYRYTKTGYEDRSDVRASDNVQVGMALKF